MVDKNVAQGRCFNSQAASVLLGVSPARVRKLVKDGRLPAETGGRDYLLSGKQSAKVQAGQRLLLRISWGVAGWETWQYLLKQGCFDILQPCSQNGFLQQECPTSA